MSRKRNNPDPAADTAKASNATNNSNRANTSSREETLEESRLHALATRAPALVYQFVRHADDSQSFPFVSDGCIRLLGIPADELHRNPERLLELIVEEDRLSYLDSMHTSASTLGAWNWEGRVQVPGWNDIKWINLRATPQALPEGGVQWDGLMTNITHGKLAEQEIRRSRRQLAELSAHVEAMIEDERTRIAREIHDDLGGTLTAIKMALAQLVKRLPPAEPALAERAAYVDALVDRSIESAHRISRDLRPSILDLGIVAAIHWQAGEFQKQVEIPCYVVATEEDLHVPKEQSTALFRIFQEALTNIAKHARATMVTVHLTRNHDSVCLEVSDNGQGLKPADRTKPKSFGLRGMQERAAALGGEAWIGVSTAGGCMVRTRLPL